MVTMSPLAFLMVAAFLPGSFVVRCAVFDPCNATKVCTDNTTVCENETCQIQAGQVCKQETTTTVAITVTTSAQTTAVTTLPGATTQVPSTTSAPTTTTKTTAPTVPTTAPPGGSGKRRKRSAGQQECVSNASCASDQASKLVCTCNEGHTAENGQCKGPKNGAGHLRVTILSVAMVTTLLLFLI